ncbi:MAG: 5-formyltetrahydrofolate cyclo-ligase [Desertimonas sp.]
MLGDVPVARTKSEWRAVLRTRRREITANPAERAARSARIWAVVAGRLRAAQRVMLFESLPSEPDTTAWFDWCREHGCAVFVPRVEGLDLRVDPGDVDPATLDVVVVPGVGFGTDGRRLGQGGGHYDRFLARLPARTLTIGVCFAEQLVDGLPVEPHDIAVHAVVSDAS